MLNLHRTANCSLCCRNKACWNASLAENGKPRGMPLRAGRVLVAGVAVGLVLSALSGTSPAACLTECVEVHLSGLEVEESRVFYWLIFRGKSEMSWQIWFFDLDGKEPTTPVRALFIEDEMGECRSGPEFDEDHVHRVWMKVARRLRRLGIPEEFDFSLRLKADSVGVDTTQAGSNLYGGHLVVETAGSTETVDLEMFCDTLISARGVYSIPGRRELIVVVSCKTYGLACQEVEVPVLIPAE